MSGHTPGPWRWEWSAQNAISIYANHGKRENPEVASLIFEGGYNEQPPESMVADAQLIAAGVDLLQACEDALTAFETLDMMALTPGKKRPIKETLRAAIAKARGG
jgi:hypothetical protein